MKIGGWVCIRNGFLLDYCWQEAVTSLLPICDEVVICDCDSTDGTRAEIDHWCSHDARITPANFPWTNPVGDIWFWPRWLNYARQHLKMQGGWGIYLDADEILHEDSYPLVKEAAEKGEALICKRLNFWRDPQHLIPEGQCCGSKVIRVGPQDTPFPSDYPNPEAEKIQAMAKESEVAIHHYGFLREQKAWFRKAKEVQRIWHNDYDKRLIEAEKFNGRWCDAPNVCGEDGKPGWENSLAEFKGTHPAIIKPWLEARGYKL